MVKTDAPQNNNGQLTTDNGLPCQNSSPICLNTLGNLAVQNSREIAVLTQAIRLHKKKLWTNWLSADGWHPVAIGLRLVRNVAGGGDYAAAKLELAQLELRQAEMDATVRQAVARAVLDTEAAQQQVTAAKTKLAAHQTRLALLTIAYRLGESSTEATLQLWQTETELQAEVETAQTHLAHRQRQLRLHVFPLTR